MGDYDWVAPLVSGIGSAVNSYATSEDASRTSQEAYEEMLRNLAERFGDYDRLGTAGYEQYIPEQLRPSALAGIQENPALRGAQQDTLAALQEMIESGGLTLADMKALNDVQRNLSQQNQARRKGIANSFAARGQLGAGAQLGMELDAAQDAAELANQRGEATAAQAQERRMSALMKRGDFAGKMSSEDYRRAKEAADAEDFINRWNASARNEGAKYRNTVRGQAFEDELSKARGKTSLTNSVNEATFGKGQDLAKTKRLQGQYRNNMLDTAGSAFGGVGKGDNGGAGGSSGGGYNSGSLDFDDYDAGDIGRGGASGAANGAEFVDEEEDA